MKRLCPFVLLACLTGCADYGQPLTGQARADAQTVTACRQRANQAFDQRGRDQIYSPPPQVNTPYSASYVPGISDRGLANQYEHDQMVSDCIRNTGTGTSRAAP